MFFPSYSKIISNFPQDIGIATFLMLLWKQGVHVGSSDHIPAGFEEEKEGQPPWHSWSRPPGGFLDFGCVDAHSFSNLRLTLFQGAETGFSCTYSSVKAIPVKALTSERERLGHTTLQRLKRICTCMLSIHSTSIPKLLSSRTHTSDRAHSS